MVIKSGLDLPTTMQVRETMQTFSVVNPTKKFKSKKKGTLRNQRNLSDFPIDDPLAPYIDLKAASDSGTNTDNITNVASPQVTIINPIAWEIGDILYIYKNLILIYTRTIGVSDLGGTEFDLGLDPLPEGTSSLRCRRSRNGVSTGIGIELEITVDTTAPTITTATSHSVQENATLAITLAANETVTWSITGGADQSDFEISGTTLRWASDGTKNYEIPDDTGSNNVYDVEVTATDTAGNTTAKQIAVTVTDVTDVLPPSYTQIGIDATAVGGHVQTWNVNIGSAGTAFFMVAVTVQNNDPDPVSITVDGTALSQIAKFPASTDVEAYQLWWYGANVTTAGGAKNIVITWTSASFEAKIAAAYRVENLTSITPKQVASGGGAGNVAISVDAGDLLFAARCRSAGTTANDFNSSTETPDHTQSSGALMTGAWNGVSATGSFNVNNPNTAYLIALTFA